MRRQYKRQIWDILQDENKNFPTYTVSRKKHKGDTRPSNQNQRFKGRYISKDNQPRRKFVTKKTAANISKQIKTKGSYWLPPPTKYIYNKKTTTAQIPSQDKTQIGFGSQRHHRQYQKYKKSQAIANAIPVAVADLAVVGEFIGASALARGAWRMGKYFAKRAIKGGPKLHIL